MPPRLARVMIENQVKPPPPPPPVEEKPKIEPEKKVAAIKPPVDRTQKARERAQATIEQFQDELADLREEMDLTPLANKESDGRRRRRFACRAITDLVEGRASERRHHHREFEPGVRHRGGLSHRPFDHRRHFEHRARRSRPDA